MSHDINVDLTTFPALKLLNSSNLQKGKSSTFEGVRKVKFKGNSATCFQSAALVQKGWTCNLFHGKL